MKTSNKNRNSSYNKATVSTIMIIIFIILFTTTSLIISSKLVSALEITSVNAPETASIGKAIILSFSSTNYDELGIYIDNRKVSEFSTYEWNLTSTDIGIHNLKFEATNEKNITTEERTITITDTPPEMTIIEPSKNDFNYKNIKISVESKDADYCYYLYENISHTLEYNNTSKYFEGNINAEEGISSIITKCVKNSAISSEEKIIHIDTTPPTIISKLPTGTINNPDSITLKVETNEISTCKYSSSQKPYEDMQLLGTTSTTIHEKSLELEDGDYEFFLLCKDIYDNTQTNYENIAFTINRIPTATIDLEGDDVKKAGTYELTLKTSEELKNIPKLSYTLQEDGKTKNIILSEVNNEMDEFKGLLVVENDLGEDVGTFNFKGYDLDNNEGTSISEGRVFRIDTEKPPKIETFNANYLEGQGVMLDWFFENEEDGLTYNIYRSVSSGVDYTDFYKTSINKEFQDKDVEDGETYFYKVAAVDKAGNEGELSSEQQITIVSDKPKISPKSNYLIEQLDKELKTKLMDVEGYNNEFNTEKDSLRVLVINKMGLVTKLSEANLELKNIQSELEKLKNSEYSDSEIEERVIKLKKQVDFLDKNFFKDFEIITNVEYNELISSPNLEETTTKFLKANSGMGREQAISNARDLSEKINVDTKIIQVKLKNNYDEEKTALLVIKNYHSTEPLQELFLVEDIPKSFSENASSIVFSKKPVIIEEDPVAQYSFNNFQDEELSYYSFTNSEINQVRGLRTAFFKKNNNPNNPNGNSTLENKDSNNNDDNNLITGNIVEEMKGFFSSNNIFILLGVIIIGGLVVYYFKMDSPTEEYGMHTFDYPIHQIIDPRIEEGTGMRTTDIRTAGLRTTGTRTLIEQNNLLNKPKTLLVKSLREDSLNELLILANESCEKNNFLDAKFYYKQACKAFEKEPFVNKEMKQAGSSELKHLYHQLLMMKLIDDSHEAIINEDYETLEKNMNSMNELSARIHPTTNTMMKANNNYEYFYNQLQKMKSKKLFSNLDLGETNVF